MDNARIYTHMSRQFRVVDRTLHAVHILSIALAITPRSKRKAGDVDIVFILSEGEMQSTAPQEPIFKWMDFDLGHHLPAPSDPRDSWPTLAVGLAAIYATCYLVHIPSTRLARMALWPVGVGGVLWFFITLKMPKSELLSARGHVRGRLGEARALMTQMWIGLISARYVGGFEWQYLKPS